MKNNRSSKRKDASSVGLLTKAQSLIYHDSLESVDQSSVKLVIINEKQQWKERTIEYSKQVNNILSVWGYAILIVDPPFIEKFQEYTADYLTVRKIVSCEITDSEWRPYSENPIDKFLVCICQKTYLLGPHAQIRLEASNVELPKSLDQNQTNFSMMLEVLITVLTQSSDTLLVYQPFEYSLGIANTLVNNLNNKTYSQLIYTGKQKGFCNYIDLAK